MNFELEFLERPSTLNENAPLLIMCHGYGSDENDLFSFATELPEELYIISLKAPYALQPYGNAWYAINFDAEQGKWSDNYQALESRDKIAEFVKQFVIEFPVDADNVTLLGFSQGTILSLAVALSYPDLVKNVVALSGYINTDIIKPNIRPTRYHKLNVFASHGSADQVIPIEWARKTPEYLKQLNIGCQYKEYPVGHGVAPQNFFDFKAWLATKI